MSNNDLLAQSSDNSNPDDQNDDVRNVDVTEEDKETNEDEKEAEERNKDEKGTEERNGDETEAQLDYETEDDYGDPDEDVTSVQEQDIPPVSSPQGMTSIEPTNTLPIRHCTEVQDRSVTPITHRRGNEFQMLMSTLDKIPRGQTPPWRSNEDRLRKAHRQEILRLYSQTITNTTAQVPPPARSGNISVTENRRPQNAHSLSAQVPPPARYGNISVTENRRPQNAHFLSAQVPPPARSGNISVTDNRRPQNAHFPSVQVLPPARYGNLSVTDNRRPQNAHSPSESSISLISMASSVSIEGPTNRREEHNSNERRQQLQNQAMETRHLDIPPEGTIEASSQATERPIFQVIYIARERPLHVTLRRQIRAVSRRLGKFVRRQLNKLSCISTEE